MRDAIETSQPLPQLIALSLNLFGLCLYGSGLVGLQRLPRKFWSIYFHGEIDKVNFDNHTRICFDRVIQLTFLLSLRHRNALCFDPKPATQSFY